MSHIWSNRYAPSKLIKFITILYVPIYLPATSENIWFNIFPFKSYSNEQYEVNTSLIDTAQQCELHVLYII